MLSLRAWMTSARSHAVPAGLDDERPLPCCPLLALRAWMKHAPSHASPTRKRGNPRPEPVEHHLREPSLDAVKHRVECLPRAGGERLHLGNEVFRTAVAEQMRERPLL